MKHTRRMINGFGSGAAHSAPRGRFPALTQGVIRILAIGLLAFTRSAPAQAQQQGSGDAQAPAAASGDEIQAIIVTANRREQTLQSVPISVTAVTSNELAVAGIQEDTFLGQTVPALQMNYVGPAVLPYIRGVGSDDSAVGDENPVAIYIDGIYQARTDASNFAFNNIERVEVLRGPQGTLFGRNATGGLIQIITRDPSDVSGGDIAVSYGNFGTLRMQAYATTGIAPNLAADLAVYYNDQSRGYGVNVNTGDQYDKTQDTSIRSKWVYTPADGTKLTFAYAHTSRSDDASLGYRTPPGELSYIGTPGPAQFQNVTNTFDPYLHLESNSVSLKASQELSGGMNLVSLTGYNSTIFHFYIDADTTPSYGTEVHSDEQDQTFTEEVQLFSPTGGNLEWVVGAFFLKDTNNLVAPYGTSLAGSVVGDADIRFFNDVGAKSYAVYADGTYKLTSSTKVTVGARYTIDDKSAAGQTNVYAMTPTLTGETLLVPGTFSNQSATFRSPTWRFILDQDLWAGSSVYASYSRGFKSGGYNGTTITDTPYRAATIDSYEIGSKNELFDHSLILNASLFYYRYRDIQVQEVLATGNQVISNAGSAEGKGGELEATWRPMHGFEARASYAYLDAKYTSYPGGTCTTPIPTGGNVVSTCDLQGKQLPKAPKNEFNVGATYSFAGPDGDFGLSLHDFYNAGYFSDADNRLREHAFNVLNANFGWNRSDGRLGLSVFANNLLNREYYIELIEQGVTDAEAPAPPRTYGFQVNYKFQ